MRRREVLKIAGLSAAGLAGVNFTSEVARAFAGEARVRAIPTPRASLTYAWRSDPYAMGSYSALPPGVPASVRRTLSSALLGGRIVFAGEYCSTNFPATTTGAYESGVNAARRLRDRAEPRSAIVVGAGIAGAAAANTLSRAGVQVTVVEARGRIGGRIYSDDSWGVPVELGAGWIHGRTGNPITALASAVGLGMHVTDYADALVRDTVTGRRSSTGAHAQQQVYREMSMLEDRWLPVGLSVDDWLVDRGVPANRFTAWAKEVEISQEYGLGPTQLGVRATEEGQYLRGPDVLVSGGYARIPATLLDGIDVRLDCPVAAITADKAGARITLNSGERMQADAVVCAVPVAVLQAGHPKVDPLPERVRTALTSLRTGELQKVVLRYDTAWWEDYAVQGIVGGGVPGAAPGTLASLRWTEFYDLTAVLGFPALAGFSGGQAARGLPSGASSAADEAQAMLAAAYAVP